MIRHVHSSLPFHLFNCDVMSCCFCCECSFSTLCFFSVPKQGLVPPLYLELSDFTHFKVVNHEINKFFAVVFIKLTFSFVTAGLVIRDKSFFRDITSITSKMGSMDEYPMSKVDI